MIWRRFWWSAFIAACGGSPKHGSTIAIVPTVAAQSWYRSPASCAQGPFELDVPTRGSRHGEDVQLRVQAPHPIALHAEVLVDGKPVHQVSGVYDSSGALFDRKPDNARCVASAQERLQLAHGGGGGGSATPGSTITPAGPQPQQSMITPQLVAVTSDVTGSGEVIEFRVPEAHGRVTIRFWSIDPNDLDGVLFGVADVTWAPNVSEAQWEAHERAEAAAEAERERREQADWERKHAHDPVVDPAVERKKAEEAERQRLEAERRAAIAEALREEQARRRAAYCDAHADDRDCWGAGGRKVHADLDRHEGERAAYCASHGEDARCWSDSDWSKRHQAWNARVNAALSPAKPEGPPPTPIAETIPPKLSVHAEWRPGYWQWTESKWVWLAGMWRVPDSDIAAEQTTRAPEPPPALKVETPPPPPVTVAVWIAGFWQWSGTSWVWIPGSWQLRPEPSATWRAPEWRARGSFHVLIPGGWVR